MASPSYSQYQYSSTTAQAQAQTQGQSIHQQLYRPTESEAAAHHEGPNVQRNSNIGKRVDKVEKGIGSFLKKLDKKF
jgi:hypothetical protein